MKTMTHSVEISASSALLYPDGFRKIWIEKYEEGKTVTLGFIMEGGIIFYLDLPPAVVRPGETYER